MEPIARAVAPIGVVGDEVLHWAYDGHGSGANSSVQQIATHRFAQFYVCSRSCPRSKDHGRLLGQRGAFGDQRIPYRELLLIPSTYVNQ